MPHPKDIIRNHEEEIYTLRSSLALLEARTSHLHNRLLTTLDTLDDVQSSCSNEVEALTREKNTLAKRVNLMRLELDSANEERDSMQDAVLRLIEKVELANGYDFLSHSKMQFKLLLEPLSQRRSKPRTSSDAYLPVFIESLTSDLTREKQHHQQTLREAETRIRTLEAQLVRRDAELEAAALNTPYSRSINFETHAVKPPKMTKEGALAILSQATERNRALEREVDVLGRKLEQARLDAFVSLDGPLVDLTIDENEDEKMVMPVVLKPTPIFTKQEPILPAQQTRRLSIKATQTEYERGISSKPEVHPLVDGWTDIWGDLGPIRVQGGEHAGRRSPSLHHSLLPLHQVLVDLERHIVDCEMDDVDDLVAERDNIFRTMNLPILDKDPPFDKTCQAEDIETVWLLEEECIRLRDAERLAQSHAAQSAEALLTREGELYQEISHLEEKLVTYEPDVEYSTDFDEISEEMGSEPERERYHTQVSEEDGNNTENNTIDTGTSQYVYAEAMFPTWRHPSGDTDESVVGPTMTFTGGLSSKSPQDVTP